MRINKFKIIIDSNEFAKGKSWTFPSNVQTTVRSLLKAGCDYSIANQVGTIGVERKSYNDYVRCLGADRKRFAKQIAKLRHNKYCAIIVEADIDSPIYSGSMMTLDAVIAGTAKITALGVPVLFASNRHNASALCLQFFKEALKRVQDGF